MQRIQPPVTELSREYYRACKRGELLLQHCVACAGYQFYPRIVCSHCGSRELSWQPSRGEGRVASYTVVRRPISKAYEAPYVVALVDLDEGPRMMSQIVDCEPGRVAVGARVGVRFEAWSDDIDLPVFSLLQEGATR